MSVRTVLGDVEPSSLGVTYAHEHLIIDSPLVAERWPEIHLPSVDEAMAEVEHCTALGVRTMVDAMPAGGRRLDRLAEISRRAGLHIVAVTGRHTAKYYLDDTPETWADLFSTDILEGGDRTPHRCGAIKVATHAEGVDDRSRALFHAAAEAHLRTGAPILTHCEGGSGGLEQIELLRGRGVDLGAVALSHVDKIADLGYHRELVETGVSLIYDQALRDPEATAGLVASMWDAGYGDRLLLGTDGARRSLWSTLGGHRGLAWLYGGFTDILNSLGVGNEQLDAMFVANPMRWLSFTAP